MTQLGPEPEPTLPFARPGTGSNEPTVPLSPVLGGPAEPTVPYQQPLPYPQNAYTPPPGWGAPAYGPGAGLPVDPRRQAYQAVAQLGR
ncbi:MAG: hypothetical protein JWP61_1415 [Friedmanniella sp.]|nr:hypothetical protein [Friedmanniella sp.]